ncbi:peptidylprolyl isomerase [Cohnella nanjingensis]|uniref:Peptidylprolyl isomerase n=1 Tax=Cohnella nanjingensis TaxID=1387779 RepID=A0A7X0VEI6_9BACL|nr:peptidylprolyl isomerase [Cohnella nanjingensis]MBB6669594.1 peptidylprolyl isomerase [Cohnella nanjingensis]
MRRTKRLLKPIVLLALTWTLFVESGCTANHSNTPAPPNADPSAIEPSGAPGTTEEAVAVVDGEPITRRQLVDQLLDSYGEQTLHVLMLRMAVEREAAAEGVVVSDEDVAQELRKMSDGYDSEEQFYAARREQLGMSPEEVRKDAKYRLQLERLAIRTVKVPESEIDRYVREHQEEFNGRVRLNFAHLVVDKRSDAEALLRQLEQGADFSALAARYSKDEETAENGGGLGWVEENDPFVDPDLLSAAAKLDVGETTGPVRTEAGYELVQLIGRDETRALDPEAARAEAREQLALDQAPPLPELEASLLAKYGAEILDRSLRS